MCLGQALTRKRVIGAGTVAFVTTLVTAAYYANHWGVESNSDTISYLDAKTLVDPFRVPVYPLFLDAFDENLTAATLAQGVLFVVAAIEIYAITCLLTQHVWVATAAALAVGTNLFLLSYAKAAIVEGLALWLVVTLALTIVLYLRDPRPRWLWLTAVILLIAMMTRPEWVYAPILLFALLARPGLRLQAAGAVASTYLIVGVYIAANAALNGYPGVTAVERVNLFSKVLQYRLQDNAPERYAELTEKINRYFAAGGIADPFAFEQEHPELTTELTADHRELEGEYARATLLNSVDAFVVETAKLVVRPTPLYEFTPEHGARDLVRHGDPFWQLLEAVAAVSRVALKAVVVFPLIVLFWLAARVRFGSGNWRLDGMLVLSLLGFYDLVIVAAGGYGDYLRLQSSNYPIRLMVVVGTLLFGLAIVREKRGARPTQGRI